MSNIARFDAWRSVASGSITSSYTALGTPFAHAMRIVQIINGTDGDIAISFDGTTDNVPVLSTGFGLYDLTCDQDFNESFRYQKGTQLFIKYLTAPTTGSVYVVCVYGKGE
jgi:hypothetical protein